MIVVMKMGGHRLHSCIIYADGLAFDLKERLTVQWLHHTLHLLASV